MPGLSEFSWSHLKTCDFRLQRLVIRTAEIYEIRVLCGRRSNEEQERLFAEGRSKLRAGQSKHNEQEHFEDGPDGKLVHAVDMVPYPIDWKDAKRFVFMAGIMMAFAEDEEVPIRWGGNWDRDMVILDDQNFDDLPHFELWEGDS